MNESIGEEEVSKECPLATSQEAFTRGKSPAPGCMVVMVVVGCRKERVEHWSNGREENLTGGGRSFARAGL